MDNIKGVRACPMCGALVMLGRACDCEGALLLSILDRVGGVNSPAKYSHLFRKEYDALWAKIRDLYTKEEFNFDSKVGKTKLIRNDYYDNFKVCIDG